MTAAAVVPIIETSTIMESSGFVNAVTIGTQAFIDDLLTGDAIAVTSFAGTGAVAYPSTSTLVTVDGTLSQLTAANAAVQALSFTGTTVNIGAGLNTAYGLFSTAPQGSRSGALLMSSGQQSTGGTDPLTLPAYVPTWVCAPGQTANTNLLNQIATISGGRYFYVPTPADMQTILNQIRGQLPGWTNVVNVANTIGSMGFWLQPATLAGGLAQAQISVVWENAGVSYTGSSNPGPGQVSVTLVKPPGITLTTPPTRSGGGWCVWDLPSPVPPGQWYVQVMYGGTTSLPMTIGVFAAPGTQAPAIELAASAPPVAGAPIVIGASVEGEHADLHVSLATVEIVSQRASLASLMRIYADLIDGADAAAAAGDAADDPVARLHAVRRALLPRGDIFAHDRRKIPVTFDSDNRAAFTAPPADGAGALNCRLHVQGSVGGEPFEQTRLISLDIGD